jgi:two-component system cell cycle response regulator
VTDVASTRDRSVARWLLGGATVLVAFYCLHTVAGVAPAGQWIELGVYHAALAACVAACLLRGLRGGRAARGWLFLGLALAAWTLADVYWQIWLRDSNTIPSPADAGYLAVYPLAYAGVLLLARARGGAVGVARWLDGVIGGLAVASVAAAIVVSAVTDAFGGDTIENVTNLAYPLGDGILLALIVGSLAVTGWRLGRMWLLMTLGLAVFAAADSAYLYLVATGTYNGGLVDCGWPVAILIIAWAAWQPDPPAHPRQLEGLRGLVLPAAFGALALGVLVYDHGTRVDVLAVVLATASVIAVMARMALAMAENARLLARARGEALTDALTGLGNRRRLLADLDAVAGSGARRTLMLFDLNGFKTYNDTFGHPAGDALLRQLGRRLGATAAEHGRAYRLGGDEFCLVVAGDPLEDGLLEAALGALRLRGDAFSVDAAWGVARMPGEARTSGDALGLADARMYEVKGASRPSAGRQSTDVLLRVLHERHPDLRDHLLGVAGLARDVGERLGLGGPDLDDLTYAAELHDVGKVAIPESILAKPGPLDPDERAFMDRHTIIGQRIVEAAPALTRAAALVRASHERWDGRGYPDRMAGEEIPIAARVVAVCDAFEAMTTGRPYRVAVSEREAVAELQRCAGGQFDPAVVASLLAVLAARETPGIALLEPPGAPTPAA